MITLLLSMVAMVFIGGGMFVFVIILLIAGIIKAIISHTPCGEPQKKLGENKVVQIEQKQYRYLLINIKTRQVVGGGDDYIAICRKKRDMGNDVMIKDRQYVKKGRIL